MVEVLCCSSLLKCVKSLIFTVALGSTNFMALLGKKHAQKQAEEIGAGLPICQAIHKKWDTLDYIGYMAMAWHVLLSFKLVFI